MNKVAPKSISIYNIQVGKECSQRSSPVRSISNTWPATLLSCQGCNRFLFFVFWPLMFGRDQGELSSSKFKSRNAATSVQRFKAVRTSMDLMVLSFRSHDRVLTGSKPNRMNSHTVASDIGLVSHVFFPEIRGNPISLQHSCGSPVSSNGLPGHSGP